LPFLFLFHVPNEHTDALIRELLSKQINDHYKETDPNKQGYKGDSFLSLADEIDKIDTKLTHGILLIGGLVAFVNPLVGVTIAAKALIPGIGGMVSKFGLRNIGKKINRREREKEIKKAKKKVLSEFKGTNTKKVVNPILRELELAISTDESEHDPLMDFDFNAIDFVGKDNARLQELTFSAIANTYRDILENKSLWKEASLGPEDIRWLNIINEVSITKRG